MLFKKSVLIFGFIIFITVPLAAQNTHIDISSPSIRPFTRFPDKCSIWLQRTAFSSYESTYLRGYMDGVNDAPYLGGQYIDRHFNHRAYRAGFKDGFRDRALMIRLRGHRWYQRYRFSRDAYYTPSIAVQIWLDGLSLAFLQAPAYKLPPQWRHRAHPKFKKYRKWFRPSVRRTKSEQLCHPALPGCGAAIQKTNPKPSPTIE
ncbi:MAG: hypothetical protein U5J63_06805 [Fodinibius sp.]|nr:hypothetical protein [Fodinibius sp.]